MEPILWIPAILAGMTSWLYILSVNIPELGTSSTQKSELKFPTSLEDLQSVSNLLLMYKEEHFLYVLVLFCSAYIYKQTFAIPGSVFMNLLAGALFGVWKSFPLVCLLTATGATCCYSLSKYFGKQYVMKYFPDRVKFMQEKVEENYDSLFFFLLFLRFFPMSPNWFLNLASPILNIPEHMFFFSVFIGLMPYNFICVQTGSMLSQINSMEDIFTTGTFIKLAGIALVALVPSFIMKKLKNKKLKSM
ncbi:transmembrane protein 41A-like [Saccostrea echinata]|uniref:transmembrane protein 41A-like n=1 Tax=Saccostrea echinata TaxID=191078 RepID=UPI002A7F3BD0|nr:transmembrane protein 41A-like [Saccostrea echinata]